MHDSIAARPAFDYDAFVNELIPLVERAHAFDANDKHVKSDAFRKWKHEVLDLINRVGRLRYDVNCGLGYRQFVVMGYGSYSEREQREKFDRDLNDTLVELDLVIERYKKYGDPHVKPAAAGNPKSLGAPIPNKEETAAPALEPLTWPDKGANLRWIITHVPVPTLCSVVAWAAVALTAAFSLGMATAGTKAGRAVLEWFTTSDSTGAAAPSPAKPASR